MVCDTGPSCRDYRSRSYLRKILPFWPTLPTVKWPALRPAGRDSSGVRCIWVLDRCNGAFRNISWLSLARIPVVVPDLSRVAFSSRFFLMRFPLCATVLARRRVDVVFFESPPGRVRFTAGSSSMRIWDSADLSLEWTGESMAEGSGSIAGDSR